MAHPLIITRPRMSKQLSAAETIFLVIGVPTLDCILTGRSNQIYLSLLPIRIYYNGQMTILISVNKHWIT
jgi:hypothetical protein